MTSQKTSCQNNTAIIKTTTTNLVYIYNCKSMNDSSEDKEEMKEEEVDDGGEEDNRRLQSIDNEYNCKLMNETVISLNDEYRLIDVKDDNNIVQFNIVNKLSFRIVDEYILGTQIYIR